MAGQFGFCVFLGDGTGALAPPLFTPAISQYGLVLAVADFNEDGRSDLAVVGFDAGDAVSVFLATGLGGFGPPVDYLARLGAFDVASGDWNGDGHADVVSAAGLSQDLSARLGDGLGALGPRTMTPIPILQSGGFVVADWNDDGREDIVLDGTAFLSDGAGGFTQTGSLPGTPWLAGDLDQDGRQDIVSWELTSSEPNGLYSMYVSPGDGAGGLRPSPGSSTTRTATPVASKGSGVRRHRRLQQ